MKISESGLENLLVKYITTLKAVAKDTITGVDVSKETQPDGSTKIKQVPRKGDVYIPKNFASALSKGMAKAIFEHIVGYINNPVVSKLNELIGQYNQLRSDCISGGIITTATAVDEITIN